MDGIDGPLKSENHQIAHIEIVLCHVNTMPITSNTQHNN